MKRTFIISIALFILTSFWDCQKKDPQKNLIKFNEEFFREYVSVLPESRLLNKSDLPEHQQQFFEEAEAQLQLLADLNDNGIPEYIVSGVSEQFLRDKIKKPYFIAIFERHETGIERLFFQQVFVPPVDFSLEKNNSHPSVVISFAFNSGYGAEIHYDDEGYHLERW